jgi:hypothetical protein
MHANRHGPSSRVVDAAPDADFPTSAVATRPAIGDRAANEASNDASSTTAGPSSAWVDRWHASNARRGSAQGSARRRGEKPVLLAKPRRERPWLANAPKSSHLRLSIEAPCTNASRRPVSELSPCMIGPISGRNAPKSAHCTARGEPRLGPGRVRQSIHGHSTSDGPRSHPDPHPRRPISRHAPDRVGRRPRHDVRIRATPLAVSVCLLSG